MSRIVYVLYSQGGLTGGQKMTLRHVETLRELGFDATCRLGKESVFPAAADYCGPISHAGPFEPDDILVIPGDAPNTLEAAARLPNPTVIFVQGAPAFWAEMATRVDAFPADRPADFLTVTQGSAATLRRLAPQARIELVSAFADERIFQPSSQRRRAVAYTPRKRPQEAKTIRELFPRFHPDRAGLEWIALQGASEQAVAEAFGQATLHLSLSRMESLGITPLEAMAAGCVCAGFAGVGGWEFATDDNGFWVADDDCEAAIDAVARADELVQTGGAPLARMLEASQAAARQWSYANFRDALEAVWMRLAPHTRLKNGPLD